MAKFPSPNLVTQPAPSGILTDAPTNIPFVGRANYIYGFSAYNNSADFVYIIINDGKLTPFTTNGDAPLNYWDDVETDPDKRSQLVPVTIIPVAPFSVTGPQWSDGPLLAAYNNLWARAVTDISGIYPVGTNVGQGAPTGEVGTILHVKTSDRILS